MSFESGMKGLQYDKSLHPLRGLFLLNAFGTPDKISLIAHLTRSKLERKSKTRTVFSKVRKNFNVVQIMTERAFI